MLENISEAHNDKQPLLLSGIELKSIDEMNIEELEIEFQNIINKKKHIKGSDPENYDFDPKYEALCDDEQKILILMMGKAKEEANLNIGETKLTKDVMGILSELQSGY